MPDVDIKTLGAIIKTAYESETDTNAFTDLEKTKLRNIEVNATADQTSSEIKAAYESEPNVISRVELVLLANGAGLVNNRLYRTTNGATFIGQTGATIFSDIPNAAPFGPMTFMHFGAIGNGAANETDIFLAAKSWCTQTGNAVIVPPGTYMCDTFLINAGEKLILKGQYKQHNPILKLNPGENNHFLRLNAPDAVLDIQDCILDQNSANQSAGHGVRSGGGLKLSLRNVKIQNTFGYGIGIQAGSTLEIEVINVSFENIGNDCIDVKDYDNGNGVFYARDIRAKNWGVNDINKPVLDIRGPADVSGIYGEADNNCIVLRLRNSGPQGRAGSGRFSNIQGIGNSVDSIKVINIQTSEGNFQINNVYSENCDIPIIQESIASGGIISSVKATGIFGSNGLSVSGSYLVIDGVDLECRDDALRCFDIEDTAVYPVILNLNATNLNPAEVQAGRINASAVGAKITGDMRISHPTSIGGTNGIGNGSASSVLDDVRGYLI